MPTFLYRVKRDCFAGPEAGNERLYYVDRPNIIGSKEAGTAAFDIVEGGWIPPHHFEPLDGGPVEPVPADFRENPLVTEIEDAPEVNTLHGLQRMQGQTQARNPVVAARERAAKAEKKKGRGKA
jgi:hypothetical protein